MIIAQSTRPHNSQTLAPHQCRCLQYLTIHPTRYIILAMPLLGQRLRQAREARGITPLQVEIDTRIRANVIQALEAGDLANLPPEPFLRGLIRSYANYLRVDVQESLDLYAVDALARAVPPPPPSRSFALKKPPTPAQPTPQPPASQPVGFNKPLTPPPAKPATPHRDLSAPVAFLSSRPGPVAPTPQRAAPMVPPSPKPTLAPTAASVLAIPSAPPETLGSSAPVADTHAHSEQSRGTRQRFLWPAGILLGLVIILGCLACGVLAYTQLQPAVSSLIAAQRTALPTHVLPTASPTSVPGAGPTSVPTLAATAPPFATFPGNPSPTPKVTPRRTLETVSGLNLDIDATQAITVQVGVDGVLVFNGPMAPGSSRSWSAKESLYLRIENFIGATVLFNGKKLGPVNFAERSLFERQWILNPNGKPVGAAPLALATATLTATTPGQVPTATRTSTPQIKNTVTPPTPTLTPFSP